VAGGEERHLIELTRYTSIAGVPPFSLGLTTPPTPASFPPSGPTGRARAAALIADAVIRDRRRVLCCGGFIEGTNGLPAGFVTLPFVIGARGVESAFPVMLSLEERSFIQRSMGEDASKIG
jgi:hypothetical protein